MSAAICAVIGSGHFHFVSAVLVAVAHRLVRLRRHFGGQLAAVFDFLFFAVTER